MTEKIAVDFEAIWQDTFKFDVEIEIYVFTMIAAAAMIVLLAKKEYTAIFVIYGYMAVYFFIYLFVRTIVVLQWE